MGIRVSGAMVPAGRQGPWSITIRKTWRRSHNACVRWRGSSTTSFSTTWLFTRPLIRRASKIAATIVGPIYRTKLILEQSKIHHRSCEGSESHAKSSSSTRIGMKPPRQRVRRVHGGSPIRQDGCRHRGPQRMIHDQHIPIYSGSFSRSGGRALTRRSGLGSWLEL